LEEGKGYNVEGTAETVLESQLNGRASQELGENLGYVGKINEVTGEVEVQERNKFEIEDVIRDARRLTKLRPEVIYTKNFFENQILTIYTKPEFD